MNQDVRERLERYFQTFDQGKEEAHADLLEPDVRFYGSLSTQVMKGAASARGIYRGVRNRLGVTSLKPLKWFGDYPEMAVLVQLVGIANLDGSPVEAIVHFEFSERLRISRLGVFWNPGPLRA
jgi:hypothetical protein